MIVQTQKKARMSLEETEDFLRSYNIRVRDLTMPENPLRIFNTHRGLPFIDQNDADARSYRIWFEDLRIESQEGGVRIRGNYVTQAKCGYKGGDNVWQPAEQKYWPIDLEVRL